MEEIVKSFIDDYKDADMVVIGLGKELSKNAIDGRLDDLLTKLLDKLDKKNFFIITSHDEDIFESFNINRRRLSNPLVQTDDGEKQWELYNKWLSATLNKKLLILELGEDFNRPNIFRWPFEKIVFINQKSKMYRINDMFYQLPADIGSRAVSYKCNAIDFLAELNGYIV